MAVMMMVVMATDLQRKFVQKDARQHENEASLRKGTGLDLILFGSLLQQETLVIQSLHELLKVIDPKVDVFGYFVQLLECKYGTFPLLWVGSA